MSEFLCGKCIKYKKAELYAYSVVVAKAKRKVCTHCAERIADAAKARNEED